MVPQKAGFLTLGLLEAIGKKYIKMQSTTQ